MKKLNIHLRMGLAAFAIAMSIKHFAISSPFTDFAEGMLTALSIVFLISGMIRISPAFSRQTKCKS